MTRLHLACLASLVLGTALLTESSAEACGGCFVPPENNTVVTDHRMILSVGQGQSTLYDQIRYQGSPASFAWVLPIAGEAQVGLSADLVFSVLDGMTQVGVVAPPRNCPPPPVCDRRNEAPQSAGFSDAGSAAPGGVTVTKQEVVGPYETVQLQATNPQALNDWLATNGFSIPADVKPVVAAYVTEHFNFLAMKLRPGATVQSMRPVRVTTSGSTVTLPLRMVAAGTGAVVGISLWVLGQGRYESTNFPMFTVKAEDIAWDWTKNASNFKEVRAAKAAATPGRGWELESSIGVSTQQLDSAIRNGFVPSPGGFGGPGGPPRNADDDYSAIPPVDGKPGKTAAEVRDEDLGVLLGRVVSGAQIRTTRMRSDLAHAALTEDLVLAASPDQGLLGTTRQVTRELNEPLCPVYDGCDVVGQAPRSEAAAMAGGSGSDGSLRSNCSTSGASGNASSGGALLAGLGALGLVVGRLRRRRSA
ncbi:MAG: DUF2330 domain-containing protein [Myxococcales bacterium]|nr:DUF2330 domain-containing protein [Myxococcales bacterium]MBL0195892.1 DUF2330 domain-containing protein [Myxococcales bacterium]HQY60637.1 DUF2330 domain-containing protein [Polyangiaceae bacterium]